ncbi:MAG: hypothetical protein P8186_25110 [Anaerolineae bacterium]
MGFLDSMKSLLGGGEERNEAGYWVYVRCRRCGETIKTRIDLSHDLSPQDGDVDLRRESPVGRARDHARRLHHRRGIRGGP